MKWIYSVDEHAQVLSLTQDEAECIAEILKTKESVLVSRAARYRDKRDGGEATERDLCLMESAERDLENVRYFIQSVTTKKDRQH